MTTAELIVREEIRRTVIRYAHCADSGRFAELAALFTEDGVLAVHGREPLVGRAAIEAFLGGTKQSVQATVANPYIRHHVTNTDIVVDGDTTARADSYFAVVTERGLDHWGRYRDRFAKVGDQWLFRERKVRTDGHAPNSWVATRPVDP